ncbi:MAG: VWA domain-containing protein [Saprospiraceae bacterium]|nr:VWA domain-containing protein [Saprospiraceae bacterium]
MLSFNWYILLALLIVPLLMFSFGLAQEKNKAVRSKLGGGLMFQRLAKAFDPRKSQLKFILSLGGIILLILSLGNLRASGEKSLVQREGVDIIIALDISKSMWAQDIQPNRSNRAKQFAMELVDACKGDRVGLALFAGQAFLQMPFTTDYSAAKLSVRTASPSIDITQGTELDELLSLASRIGKKDEQKKQRALVVITDGEIHKKSEADLNALIDHVKEAKSDGITTFIVGMGTESGAPIPIPNKGYQKDENGKPVQSKMNTRLLKKIAIAGGGIFVDGTSGSRQIIQQLKSKMATLDREAFEDQETQKYYPLFYWFAIPAFLFLLIEAMLSYRKDGWFLNEKRKA